MSSFSLAVRFKGDECSSCDAAFMDAVSSAVGSLDELLIVEAESIAMLLSPQRPSGEIVTTAAILIPPALMGSYSAIMSATISSKQCKSLQTFPHEGIQARILGQIHQLLEQEEQCQIKGLIRSTGLAQPRISDVLLLDISRCYGGWLDEMTRKLSGEPMNFCDSAAIELFPLSTITTGRTANAASVTGPMYEIPTCAVCIHRIYPPRLGMPKPRNDQLCSEYCTGAAAAGGCRNQNYLRPWPAPSGCKACKMIAQNHHKTASLFTNRGGVTSPSELKDVFCNCCALQETLWICLTCGFVGCGRYSQGHAANHFSETKHAFSLEMATLRIWEYVSGEFAHRGDLLECPSVRRHHPQWADVALPWEDGKAAATSPKAAHLDEAPPKKATMIGEEYEALLQSALEDQAQHYEGEMSRLHAALTAEQIDENTITESETAEIVKLKSEIRRSREELEVVGRNLLDMQAQEAGHRAASQRLLREQGIAKDLLDKIREEADKEHAQGKMQVEDLEQQVADLTGNLRMRHKISQDEELNQAQIYGTVTTKQVTPKRGGKKSRRGNRK